MSDWPSIGVTRAALNGIREVFKSEAGETVTGIRSSAPWVFVILEGDRAGVICERCETVEPLPAPPSSRGLNGKPEPIFGTRTKDYAAFLLSNLYPFLAKHFECKKANQEEEKAS